MDKIPQRLGHPILIWQIQYMNEERFSYKLFVRGTEEEVSAYMKSEMGFMGRYSACTKEEEKAIKTLGLKVYLAPEILY